MSAIAKWFLFFPPFQTFHDLIELRMEEIRTAARLEAGHALSEGDEDGHGTAICFLSAVCCFALKLS